MRKRLEDLRAFIQVGEVRGATSLDATPAAARPAADKARMAAAQTRVDETVGALAPTKRFRARTLANFLSVKPHWCRPEPNETVPFSGMTWQSPRASSL